jgi:hypothetical protein
MAKIHYEGKRGCGYRKPGGMYLFGLDEGTTCGRIPVPLETCPCCGFGIKPTRGFQWVDGDKMLWSARDTECSAPAKVCNFCVLDKMLRGSYSFGKVGLIWVGSKFYPTTKDFQKEAAAMGLSRRINSIPNDFVIGETFVFLAHRKAIATYSGEEPVYKPGIFRIWKPQEIQYVIKPDDTQEKIDKLEAKGVTPIWIRSREGE